MSDTPTGPWSRFSRRSFLKGASAAAVTGPVARSLPQDPSTDETYEPGEHEVTLGINGARRTLRVEPRTTLLDALRDRLDLTGAKRICDRGACGGCTVLLDGEPVNSCMTLTLDALDQEITTIEGLSADGELHPLQQSFVTEDALQCGFCTPGMVMASYACLQRHGNPSRQQVREDLSGNLCRCGTYGRIFEAVERVGRGGGR